MDLLIVDRFEETWAVIEYRPGLTFSLPRELLPEGVREGDVLTLVLNVDRDETGRRQQEIRGWLEDLTGEDQGGDIEL